MQNTTETVKRGPGRPRLDNPLSNAERQRRWRLKQRERNAQMYRLITQLLTASSLNK